MNFEVAHAEGFPLELGRAPRKVHNAYQKTILPELRARPDIVDPPRVKKLDGYKNLWRYRVSDEWRLIYRVDQHERMVTMLMLGHRGQVYERIGRDPSGVPGIRIVAQAPELLERQPSDEEVGHAVLALANQSEDVVRGGEKAPLELTAEMLAQWSVPEIYIPLLSAANTEEKLLALTDRIPNAVIERVLNGLFPPLIDELTQRPTRLSGSAEDVIAAANGDRPLSSFLLKLDDVQKAFVSRFEQEGTRGPWLIKGGPGSGKSTVAVYCARALQRKATSSLPLGGTPPKILYTTFTNALTSASEYLIRELGGSNAACPIEVSTVDKLVRANLANAGRVRLATKGEDWQPILRKCLTDCADSEKASGFGEDDLEFIYKEIDWVIFGQGLRSSEEYEAADRRGRGRRIGGQQRKLIWKIHVEFRKALRSAGFALASDLAAEALSTVSPKYDFVFIDEAQDLKPVHIRFAVGLCKSPDGVFLTADGNQSIYGNGISWRSVAEALRFGGRVRTLNRNYRTTKEIWQALRDLAPDSADADPETLELAGVFRGPWPRFVKYQSDAAARKRLNAFIRDALIQERVGPSCVAVLCPTNRQAEQAAGWLDRALNPRLMRSSEMDLDHPGVKVMTIHASKGLQFPIVVVAGVEAGRQLPGTSPLDREEQDARDQRVLFVGCSRAMRQLMVLGNQSRPSPLASRISDEHWEIEEL